MLTDKISSRNRVSRGDIAKLAGVSGASVSYALSSTDAHRIKPETRERIARIAAELGYKPSFAGKTLSSGRSYNVAISLASEHMFASQHTMAIVQGISRKATQTDFNLTLFFASELEKCARTIESRRVDGLIVIRDELAPSLARLAADIPVVVVDGMDDGPYTQQFRLVRSDHEKMVKNAIEHFAARNRGRLLAVLGMERSSKIAAKAFSSECAARIGQLSGTILMPGKSFSRQIQGMLREAPHWDAFLVDNECLSNLLLDELQNLGLRAGTDFDMAVYSIANQRFSCNSYRNKVRCDRLYVEQEFEMGEAAWDAFEHISAGEDTPGTRLIPYRLWEKPETLLPCHWNSES